MPEPEQHEIPFQGRRIKNPRLRRGIFLLPSLFTVANLLCGYYAVVASLLGGRDDFDHAAKAIGFAILFDSLDGRIARMTGTNTEFGVQLDSLAVPGGWRDSTCRAWRRGVQSISWACRRRRRPV